MGAHEGAPTASMFDVFPWDGAPFSNGHGNEARMGYDNGYG